jgi:hypothetical protein
MIMYRVAEGHARTSGCRPFWHVLMCSLYTLVIMFYSPHAAAQAVGGCEIFMDGGGVVDLGRLGVNARANSGAEVNLGRRTVLLTLSCEEATVMELRYRGMPSGTSAYGFPGTREQAIYTLTAGDAVLDGESVQLGLLETEGAAPSVINTELEFSPTNALVPIKAARPVAGRSLSMRVVVEGWSTGSAIRVPDELVWAADGHFEMLQGAARDLLVSVNIAPSACSISIDDAGVVDFHEIPVATLAQAQATELQSKSIGFGVRCDRPMRFALGIEDMRSGTGPAEVSTSFGLGSDRSGNSIGFYEIRLNPLEVYAVRDDVVPGPIMIVESPPGGAAWGPPSPDEAKMSTHAWIGFSDASGGVGGPSWLTELRAKLHVVPTVASVRSLDISDGLELDGRVTLHITYP